jgi:hypothetical protein
MFEGIIKAALPTVAAAAFIAMAATSAPALTLSAPSLDKSVAGSNVEKTYFRYGLHGRVWGGRRPWGYGYGWGHPWAYGYGRPLGYGWGYRRRWW